MKISWFAPRNCYRLQKPARFSDDKKRQSLYFDTKEEGDKYVRDLLKRSASNCTVRMPQSDQVFLENLRSLLGSNEEIQQAVDFYRKTVLSVIKPQAGAAWFALRPAAPDNVVSMTAAA